MIELPPELEVTNPNNAQWVAVTVILDVGAYYGYRKGETCYVSDKPLGNGKHLLFSGYRKAHWHWYPASEISRFVKAKRTATGKPIVGDETKINFELKKSVQMRYEE